MDISTLSLVQLKELQQQIPAEIKRREKEEKVKLLNELQSLAVARGFSLEQLLKSDVGGDKVKKTVKAKYRNPLNAEQTWTGRGRKPQWVLDQLAQGKTIESLAI
jgi:DNA-binding protein H-NS